MLGRLVVRLRTQHPALPSAGHALLDRLAWASHRTLYVALFGQALSGLVMALQTGLPASCSAAAPCLPHFWSIR